MESNKALTLILAAICMIIAVNCNAQRLAVSTNAVYWAMLSPNMNVEFALSRHSSVSIEAAALPWNISDKNSIAHITVSPDYKYWFNMPFFGHYAGINALYSSYQQVKNSETKTGNIVALGANYGYAFLINRRFNVVPNIGIGAGYDFRDGKRSIVFVPTRIGINLQMVIK